MSNILDHTLPALKYLVGFGPSAYEGDPNYEIDPDVSSVAGLPVKYWKWNGSALVPMTAGEQSAYEAGVLSASISGLTAGILDPNYPDLLRALAIVMMKEINLLRTAIESINQFSGSLPQRTKSQIVAALEAEMS